MNEQTKQNEKKTIRPEAWTDQTTNKLIGYYNSAGLGDNSGTFNLKSVIPTLKSLLEKHTQEPACQRLLTSLLQYDCRTGQNSVEELDRLYNEFKSNIEPFARIILNYCSNGITPKPNGSSIGQINKSLLEILKTKCRPNDTELNLLTTSFSKGENFRNAQQHNAADPNARHLMSISCNTALEYIFAVTAIYRKIQRARGGVRFTSDCRCDLNFLQDRCSPIPFSKIEADKTIQIEGKPGAFRLQITITIDDGSQRILNREGTIIQGKYLDLTFSLSQEMNIGRKDLNVSNPLIDEEDEEDEIEGIPYHGGIYIGPINDKGQPHGIGILHKQGIKFSGRFNHGQPAGPFIVSGEGFDYKGSVRTEGEMWSLNQGTMTRRIRKKSGEQTWSIEGNFKDLFCVEGKLSVDGQLIYEGPFAIKKGHEVAEGNGMLYLPGGATYRGELVNGKPQGRGIWLNADLTEAHYADWIGGKLLGEETRIIKISGDGPAYLCDGVSLLCSLSGHPLRLHIYDIANLMLNAKKQEGRSVDCPTNSNLFHYELIDYDQLILKPQEGKNGKWGYMDEQGKVFIPYRYDKANAFVDGVATVEQEGKIGFISPKGTFLCPCQFDKVRAFSEGLAAVEQNDKWGFIDKSGQIVVPCQFDDIGNFSEGLAAVEQNDKWGYIDKAGNIVIPCLFEKAGYFKDGQSKVTYRGKVICIGKDWKEPKFDYDRMLLFPAQDENKKWGFKNEEDYIMIAYEFEEAKYFSEGLAAVKQNEKWGFIDKTGEMVIPCQFDDVRNFLERLAAVKKDGKWGYINNTGKFVILPCWSDYEIMSLSPAQGENKRWGFKNKEGYLMIAYEFEEAKPFIDELAIVKRNGKWGYIDKTGKMVIPCQFEEARIFFEGLASVEKNGKWGYIDRIGKMVIPCQFDNCSRFYNEHASVQQNGKWGYIDRTGKIVISCQFDDVDDYFGKLTKVKQNDKWGFINKMGKMVIPCQFDDIGYFQEGLISVQQNGKWGFVNMTGKIVTLCQFDIIGNFSDGLVVVQQNGKWGYVDKTGKLVIPCQFDDAFKFSFTRKDQANVMKDGKSFYIDKAGNIVSEIVWNTTEKPVDTSKSSSPSEKKDEKSKDCMQSVDFGLDKPGISSKKGDNGKYGFVDEKGALIVPYQYDYVSSFHEGLCAVKRNELWGFIDTSGKIIITPQYAFAEKFQEGLALVQVTTFLSRLGYFLNFETNEGKYGYIDKTGKMVISALFEDALHFQEGLACVKVKQNGKWGYIDKTGKIVIPCQFDYFGNFFEGLARVLQNGKYGFIDKTGKIVIPYLFEKAGYFNGDQAKVTYRGKEISIGKDWKEPKFDYGRMLLSPALGENKKWGFKNEDGYLMIAYEFEEVKHFSDGLAAVKLNGKWGFIDKTGKMAIFYKYTAVGSFINGQAKVRLLGKWIKIDKTGKRVN